MNIQIFKTILFVAASIILLSTVYAQISGKTKTDSIQTLPPATSAINVLKPQTTCPVMGGEINRELYVDYKDKRIYVCCADCAEQVTKDPEMYIRKLEGMGQIVETIDNETRKAGSRRQAVIGR